MAERTPYVPGATEARLATLCSYASTFEALLELPQAKIGQLVEHRRQVVRATLADLQVAVDSLLTLAPGVKADVRAAIGALDAVLSSRGGARPRSPQEQKRLADASAELEARLATTLSRSGPRVERSVLAARRRYQHAADALHAEMKVAAACRRLTAGYRGRALVQRKRELAERLRSLNQQLEKQRALLAEQRERSAALWRALDAELRESVEEVGAALTRLLA